MREPKVLIFGQSFNRYSGGGITLINLFQNWPKENLAVLCMGHMAGNIDSGICNNYYQLGNLEHKWKFPFNKIQKKFASGALTIQANENLNKPPIKQGLRNKFVDSIFYPLLRYSGLFYTLSSIHLSEKLKIWLKEFNADILYIQVSERDAILFARELHQFLKIPMVIHIMDDWPSTIVPNGITHNYWFKKIDSEFKKLLKDCSLRMSISEDMANEYYERYGERFIPFHNPIDINFWKQYQRQVYALSTSPTVLYAGRVGIGIDTSLEVMAKAIDIVNTEKNISLRFILQTHKKPEWFAKYKCLVHSPFVRYDELPKKFAEADFLLLPYDFSKKAIKFIRLSMPTKAPEYMISGTPVIVFAPQITAISKYAMRYNWAKVITSNNIKKITASITQLLQDENERKEIAENAKTIAEENYDLKKVTENFYNALTALVNK